MGISREVPFYGPDGFIGIPNAPDDTGAAQALYDGMGDYRYLDGIQTRDYPLVQGCVLFIAGLYVLVNLLTDLAYAWVDPRVSVE